MFIAALFIITKLWKEPKCPSTDEWIKKMWYTHTHRHTHTHTHTMEYYSTIRKNNYPTFASTWMGLEEITLSEISQSEKDKYHMISLTCGI